MKLPIIIEEDKILPFDIDDTLLIWNFPTDLPDLESKLIKVESPFQTEHLLPHEKHIAEVKLKAQDGYFIVLWSQNGAAWAVAAAKALNIFHLAGLIITKPRDYYDDLPASAWMNQLFLK